jgi:hypothetical protein
MRDFDPGRSEPSIGRGTPPEDLREATIRFKETQEELRQMEFAPETKRGEDRLDRYEREVRLRSMREDFQAGAESQIPRPRNTAFLALVMTVASFLMCAFCAGGTFFGLQLLGQAPNPQTSSDGFWQSVKGADYTTAHDSYLSPGLAGTQNVQQFSQIAQQADTKYGKVTSANVLTTQMNGRTEALITYTVVRAGGTSGSNKSYPVVITLELRQNAWSISDYGNAFSPSASSIPSERPLARAPANVARVRAPV